MLTPEEIDHLKAAKILVAQQVSKIAASEIREHPKVYELLDRLSAVSNDINIILERTSQGETLEEAWKHCSLYKRYATSVDMAGSSTSTTEAGDVHFTTALRRYL